MSNESDPSPDDKGLAEARFFCQEQLRQHDPDRYLTCFLAPASDRAGLTALYAFNLEIALIAESVSEPMLGEIRFQWWRDALDEIPRINDKPAATGDTAQRHHMVVQALAPLVGAKRVSIDDLSTLIDARTTDLDPASIVSDGDFIDYARHTGGKLSEIAAGALGQNDPGLVEAASNIGTAWAMTGVLRALPFQAARGNIFLADATLDQFGLSRSDVLAGRFSPELGRMTAHIADHAFGLVNQSRDAFRVAGRSTARPAAEARPVFALARLVEVYGRDLARRGYNPFAAERPSLPLRRIASILRSAIGSKF